MTSELPKRDWHPDPSGKPDQNYWDDQLRPTDTHAAGPPADQPPPQFGTPPSPPGQRRGRSLNWPLIVTIVVGLAAAGVTGYLLWLHSTTSRRAAPMTAAALEGLLLSPAQISSAVGANAMEAKDTRAGMDDDSDVPDKQCLGVYAPAQAPVYAGSRYSLARGQRLGEPGNNPIHVVRQFVVMFSDAQDARAFFTASAQTWPACSNRTVFVDAVPEENGWGAGVRTVSNTNGTLSATNYRSGSRTEYCQRALTVANNVVIDIQTCLENGSEPQPDSAVNIAHQIAAKVPK